jgi:succinate-semialdehyde dehydrogenase/glutarate-semialdehyde dehydrogenase
LAITTKLDITDYAVVNPASGEILELFDFDSDSQLDKVLLTSNRSYNEWSNLDYDSRSSFFVKLSEILRRDKIDLANTVAIEMGKPISQGIAEVEKCALVCEYFASNAKTFLASYDVKTEFSISRVNYKPLGIIFGIMPWNFPLWQVFRAAAPIIMSGNTFLLKHAPRVPRTAMSIEKLFLNAGFPKGVFNNIFASNEQSEKVISNPLVKGVCLTGSCAAGKKVAAAAGKYLKPILLELGGSDPYIILEDADINIAAEKTAFSRMLNNGQTCISAKRFIVVESVAKKFTETVISELNKYIIGDPLDESTTQGPLSRSDLLTNLKDQVDRSLHSGAKLAFQSSNPFKKGNFCPITLLTDVEPGMAAFDEELFGPVGAITTVKSTEEAIDLANKTTFGLGAAVFTQNIKKGINIAENEIRAGTCVVNDFVRSDPRLPFGGINESGFGRELGVEGIKYFCNVKTVISV